MANSTFAKNLDLVAYPNAMTKDIDDDYVLKVKTQPKSLSPADIAREVAKNELSQAVDRTKVKVSVNGAYPRNDR